MDQTVTSRNEEMITNCGKLHYALPSLSINAYLFNESQFSQCASSLTRLSGYCQMTYLRGSPVQVTTLLAPLPSAHSHFAIKFNPPSNGVVGINADEAVRLMQAVGDKRVEWNDSLYYIGGREQLQSLNFIRPFPPSRPFFDPHLPIF
jgi:hypothetical protein